MNALTTTEQTELRNLEIVIENGLQTFFDVGNALSAIRSQRLYRASHETFEEYCNQRWKMSRSYASRMIGAADVVNNLLPIGNNEPLPTNESQARPLTKLEPEQQRQAWQTAVEATGGNVTATAVKQAVEEITNPEEIAYEWLKTYTDGHRNWTSLTANQTYHGSSPCWQRYERELPYIAKGSKGKLHLKIARERLLYERNLTITPEQVEGLITAAVNDWLHENASVVEIADLLQRWMTPNNGSFLPSRNKLDDRTEGISPNKIRAALEACYERVAYIHDDPPITQMPGEDTERYLARTLDNIEKTTVTKPQPESSEERRQRHMRKTRLYFKPMQDYAATCDYLSPDDEQVDTEVALVGLLSGQVNIYDPADLQKKLKHLTKEEITKQLYAHPIRHIDDAIINVRRWLNQQTGTSETSTIEPERGEDIADVMFQHLTGTKPTPVSAPDVNVHDPIMLWMFHKHPQDLRGQFAVMKNLLEHQEDSELWPELIEQLPSGWKKRQVVNTIKLFYNLTRRLLFGIDVAEARTKLLVIVSKLDSKTERDTLFLLNTAVLKLFDAEKQLKNSSLAEETIPHTWKP
ncbi:MAG: hypothetical protein IPM39_24960 [Chloroflexi bacterium]|nr:hypothetical protein [Chloroflexota bacterium]